MLPTRLWSSTTISIWNPFFPLQMSGYTTCVYSPFCRVSTMPGIRVVCRWPCTRWTWSPRRNCWRRRILWSHQIWCCTGSTALRWPSNTRRTWPASATVLCTNCTLRPPSARSDRRSLRIPSSSCGRQIKQRSKCSDCQQSPGKTRDLPR